MTETRYCRKHRRDSPVEDIHDEALNDHVTPVRVTDLACGCRPYTHIKDNP